MQRNQLPKIVACALLAVSLAGCGGNGDDPPVATRTATPVSTATPPPSSTPRATDTVRPPATSTPPPTTTATPPSTATVADTATVTPTNTSSVADELAATGVGRYLGAIAPVSMTSSDTWDAHFFDPAAEQAICLRGGQYQVEVHRGTTNKVLLYLEGGGACWNEATCWDSPTAKLTAVPSFGGGIFEFDNPANPFRDWTVVYAPYCDGSVFSGDNVADYGGRRTFHHGLQNLSAAVTLMQAQFPAPELIAVAGSSAGGYGTYQGYAVTRIAYPEAPIVVFNDSGPGLQNSDDDQTNQDRLDNWQIAQFVPTTCTSCAMQLTYLTEWALDRDPTLRVGYFSYLRDFVIRSFNQLSAAAYEALLREVTDDLRTRQPARFKRFFVQGEAHTVLELPQFFTTEVAGTSLRDWTADLLGDGPAWQDIVEAPNPFQGFRSARYAGESLWLCRPDLGTDQCAGNDIDATAVLPDNMLRVEPHQPAAEEPDDDCFYIYPTVDLSSTAGNHTDFSDIRFELDPLLSQAARFNGSCRVFAPLYRQVTIGTYLSGDPRAQEYFDIAYADVEEAFRHYMGQYNHGRNFVIMGHSQGTAMTTQLLQRLIDPDPQLRERLIAALLIGGGVTVPDGETVGGTFQHVPLCTDVDQTGCVIAYRSYADGYPPAGGSNVVGPEGTDTACTNPAALGGGKAHFSATYLPLFAYQPAFQVGMDNPLGIATPFALLRDFYTGECVRDDQGRSYLQIGIAPQPGDQRTNQIPFDAFLFNPGFLGTHVLDYNFALGDLIDVVEHKAAVLRASR